MKKKINYWWIIAGFVLLYLLIKGGMKQKIVKVKDQVTGKPLIKPGIFQFPTSNKPLTTGF